MAAKRISPTEWEVLFPAIIKAVQTHGHPLNVPHGSLDGVPMHVQEVAFMGLTEQHLPAEVTKARARWIWILAEQVGD